MYITFLPLTRILNSIKKLYVFPQNNSIRCLVNLWLVLDPVNFDTIISAYQHLDIIENFSIL
jgi:hypothetical protein